jgi:hypothetical protein
MKNFHIETSVYRAGEKIRRFVFLLVLATGSLLMVTALDALSGEPAGESGRGSGPCAEHHGESSVTEFVAGKDKGDSPGATVQISHILPVPRLTAVVPRIASDSPLSHFWFNTKRHR